MKFRILNSCRRLEDKIEEIFQRAGQKGCKKEIRGSYLPIQHMKGKNYRVEENVWRKLIIIEQKTWVFTLKGLTEWSA